MFAAIKTAVFMGLARLADADRHIGLVRTLVAIAAGDKDLRAQIARLGVAMRLVTARPSAEPTRWLC
jgi:hypothetical protein